MKTVILAIALILSGCASMTPNERTVAAVGTVLVTSLALSHGHGNHAPQAAFGPPAAFPCHPQPDGTCR